MARLQLLDLPLELQRKVYGHAVESWDLMVTWYNADGSEIDYPDYDVTAGFMTISASPCLAWLTVCHEFEREFRPLIQSSFSGTLHFPQGQMIDFYPRKFLAMARRWGKYILRFEDSYTYTQTRMLYLQRSCIDWTLLPSLRKIDFAESRCISSREGICPLTNLRIIMGDICLRDILDRKRDGQLWGQISRNLQFQDLRILYRLETSIKCEWTIAIDIRETWPREFLRLHDLDGDILRLKFRAPWSFVTSQYPYDIPSNYQDKTGTELNVTPLDLQLTISVAYSAWYKEACGSPSSSYFERTALSWAAAADYQPNGDHHYRKWIRFVSDDVPQGGYQAAEDSTWPETPWMRNGELSLL